MKQMGILLFALLYCSFCAAPLPGQVTVILNDGSRLSARDLTLQAETCKLIHPVSILASDGKSDLFSIPRKNLVSVAFQKPVSTEQWNKFQNSVHDTDRIIVDRGGNLDFYAGTVPEISAEKVFFRPHVSEATEATEKTFQLNRSKIVGVIFANLSRSSSTSQAGQTLLLKNSDVLYSVLTQPKEANGQLPWKLASGLDGLVSVEKIVSRQVRRDNTVSLTKIKPTTVRALPLAETTPLTTPRFDWKDEGVYRTISEREAILLPPCLVVWPVPSGTIRVEGHVRRADWSQAPRQHPELKLTVRNGDNIVFQETLDSPQQQIPFSFSPAGGTSIEWRIEFQHGPEPGGAVVLSGDFITASPVKSP